MAPEERPDLGQILLQSQPTSPKMALQDGRGEAQFTGVGRTEFAGNYCHMKYEVFFHCTYFPEILAKFWPH